MDYPGKVITKNQVTPTQTSATGVWTLDDAAAAVKNNNWPVAGVPNPISKSLRFNSADSAYLNRTFGSVGNRTTWTYSVWLKRSSFASFQRFLSDSTNNSYFRFNTSDVLDWNFHNGTTSYGLATSQVFRDPSAWYHIVVAVDTTQATSSNRVKIYVNGSQVTAFSSASYPPQNATSNFNNNTAHYISSYSATAEYFNGYLTEINFIDGQALTPSSFGMTDPITGVWEPLKYSGTYGTNGFYLNFKDATSTTTLGYDYSGNANNWTTNNFSVTAGAGNDSLTDVPTPWVAYNTTGDVGGVFRGNYATWNPLLDWKTNGSAFTLSNGNLDVSEPSATTWGSVASTISMPSGKWYCEITATTVGAAQYTYIGITATTSAAGFPGQTATSYSYRANGNKLNNDATGAGVAYGASYAANDIIGIAFDADAGSLTFYKNGTSQGTAYTGISAGSYYFVVGDYATSQSSAFTANFGQRPFAYTPPSGFRSLCTTNLPASTIVDGDQYFNAVLYTGNNSTNTITGLDFQPDLVWIKGRSQSSNNVLQDVIRGATKYLISNSTGAEGTDGSLTAFNSNGFTLTTDAGVSFNANGTTYVAWNWKANGAGVTNTAGTITSTVSANTTSGFSIVTYTGTGSAATFGHGLGVTPAMYIVKIRNGANNWVVWHNKLANTTTSYILLDSTAAETTSANIWGSTAATSTTIGVGTAAATNANASTYVAYCFAAISGFSAFGSYTGNNSADGPFVYLGFRPAWVMFRNSVAVSNWWIYDAKRNTYNVMDLGLRADLSNAELTYSFIDCLSNGFKLRNTGSDGNGNGNTIIYAAFAENPFKNALAR